MEEDNHGTGYQIQQFWQDENFCRIQAGEYGGVYVWAHEAEEKEEAFRTLGYFGNIDGAIRKYIELSQLDVLDGERLTLEEYVDSIQKINAISLQGIQEELRRFPVK